MSVEKLQSPTNSCNGVVLALSEDHHSLPLVIFFRKVLGLLRNFCDVIGLFKKKNKTKQLGDERVNMNEDIMRT